MTTANIVYEKFAAALETTRGTLVTPPDHHLGFTGELTPKQDWKALDQNYGVQADETTDPVLLRGTADWTGKGDLVVERLPWWLNTCVKGGVTAPVTNNKVVASFTVGAGGSGYTTPPTVTFSGGSPLIAAKAHSVLTADAVTSIVVDNPGLGYASAPTIGFTGGGGTGATATATLATPTTAKLWAFTKTETADDISTFTGYWGDPNVQIYQSTFAVVTEFGIKSDAAGTNLVQADVKGFAAFLNEVGAPSFPAVGTATGLMPVSTQIWIDPASGNFGDTLISTVNSLVSADATLMTNAEPVYTAQGPGGTVSFTKITRKKGTACKLSLVNTFDSTALYDYAVAATSTRMKVRVRWNGPAIETAGGVIFYNFVQIDILGKLRVNGWGNTATTQRTLKLDVNASYRSADATSLSVYVQTTATSV